MDESTGRNMLHMVRTYRERAEYWEAAHGALADEFRGYINRMDERLTGIEDSLAAERKAWKAALRRAKAPGLGLIAGGGYGTSGDLQMVIGVGFVWKFW